MTEASIIYGLHAVRRAIESGQAGHLYVRSGKRSPGLTTWPFVRLIKYWSGSMNLVSTR